MCGAIELGKLKLTRKGISHFDLWLQATTKNMFYILSYTSAKFMFDKEWTLVNYQSSLWMGQLHDHEWISEIYWCLCCRIFKWRHFQVIAGAVLAKSGCCNSSTDKYEYAKWRFCRPWGSYPHCCWYTWSSLLLLYLELSSQSLWISIQ